VPVGSARGWGKVAYFEKPVMIHPCKSDKFWEVKVHNRLNENSKEALHERVLRSTTRPAVQERS